MPKWLNPANFCTLLRMILVPFVILAIFFGEHLKAAWIFSAAAVTDLLDGELARHFGWSTPAGAYFDPIADKLLLSGVFLALAGAGSVPWWFVGIVFGRDILILAAAAAALLFTRLRKFPPSRWGKLSTFFQIVTAVAWMAHNAFPSAPLGAPARVLIWPSTCLTVWSGIHYAWRGARMLRTD